MQKKNTIILYGFFIIIYPLFSQPDSVLEKRFLQALELDWNGEDSLALECYMDILEDEPQNNKVYSNIANLFFSPKKVKQGVEFFNSLLKSDPTNGYAYYGLARISKYENNYKQALKYLKKCITLKPHFSSAYGPYDGLGSHYQTMGNYNLAIKYYKEALTKKDYYKWFYIETSHRLYNIYDKLGKASEAEETKKYLINLMNDLLTHYDSEPNIAARRFDKLQELINMYYEFEEINAGLKVSNKYLSLAEKENDKKNIEYAYSLIGTFKLYLGEYSSSLNYLLKSLNMEQLKYGDFKVIINIGAVFAWIKNYSKSLEYYSMALKLARKSKKWNQEVLVITNIGHVLNFQGKYIEALNSFKNAKNIFHIFYNGNGRKIVKETYSQILLGMADSYYGLRNLQKSLLYCQEALESTKKLNNQKLEADVLISLANIYRDLNEIETAKQIYLKTLKIQKTIEFVNNEYYWRSQIGLGKCFLKENKRKEAISFFKNAITLFDSLRQSFTNEIENYSRLSNYYYEIYHLLTKLYMQEEEYEKAYTTINKYKSITLITLLSRTRPYVNFILNDSINSELKEITLKQKTLHSQFSKISNNDFRQNQELFNLKKQIIENDIKKSFIQDSIKAQNAYADNVLSPETTTLKEMQNNFLEENTVIIEYMVGDSSLIIFAIAKDSVFSKELPISRKNLENKLSAISSFYRFKESEKLDFNTNIVNAQMANFSIPGLYEAYKVLIKPLESFIKDSKELIIIPDDLLYYLPFEALVSDTSLIHNKYDFTNTEFMLEKYDISYSPSASLLNWQFQNRQNDLQFDVLALGNPDYSDLKINDSLRITSPAYVRGMKNLQPLLHAEKEVVTIGEILGEKNSKVFSGFQATEENFKTHAADSRILHLATHFMTNDKDPMYSKIALAKNEASAEDGLLHPFEIFSMNLNAEMVVLSACNTALGKISKGEGIIGVSRAFHYAGIPSLVVSQWNVDDQATSNIMSSFYAYLKKGFSKNRALKYAKLDYLKSAESEFKNPFYWAPFILMGNQQPIEFNRNDNYLYWIFLIFLVLIGLILLHKRKFFTIKMH